jgi:hypothetical protein
MVQSSPYLLLSLDKHVYQHHVNMKPLAALVKQSALLYVKSFCGCFEIISWNYPEHHASHQMQHSNALSQN